MKLENYLQKKVNIVKHGLLYKNGGVWEKNRTFNEIKWIKKMIKKWREFVD